MNDCLFCKIIKGEIPSYKVYEDEKVYAFFDVNPNSDGHTLVVPKEHIDVIKTKIYPILKDKLNTNGLTICQNNYYGQDVKHYHIHLIPRYNNDSFKCTFDSNMLSNLDEVYEKLKNE